MREKTEVVLLAVSFLLQVLSFLLQALSFVDSGLTRLAREKACYRKDTACKRKDRTCKNRFICGPVFSYNLCLFSCKLCILRGQNPQKKELVIEKTRKDCITSCGFSLASFVFSITSSVYCGFWPHKRHEPVFASSVFSITSSVLY